MTNEFTPESERQRLQYLVFFSVLILMFQKRTHLYRLSLVHASGSSCPENCKLLTLICQDQRVTTLQMTAFISI